MDETTTGGAAMGPAVAGRRAADLFRFSDLAGVRLYRRNAFAVTGLPADARGRAVRQHRQRLETRLAVENTWPGDTDSPLVGGHRKDEIRAAFEEFQDPRRRLVDELVWLWGNADLGCDCPDRVHEQHDEAVRLHARALEAEAGRLTLPADERDDLWSGAASHWGALLQGPEFRAHVAHRIRAFDDPRLGEVSADAFLARIPRLLVSPFGELVADPAFGPRITRVCGDWATYEAFSALFDELFEETVEETIGRIAEGLRSADENYSAMLYEDAALVLRQQVVPAFERLTDLGAFVPDRRYDDEALTVATALSVVARELADQYRRHSGQRRVRHPSQHRARLVRFPTAEQREGLLELLEKAHDIAPADMADTIEAHWYRIYSEFGEHARPARAKTKGRGLEGSFGWVVVLLFMVIYVVLIVANS